MRDGAVYLLSFVIPECPEFVIPECLEFVIPECFSRGSSLTIPRATRDKLRQLFELSTNWIPAKSTRE